MISIVLILHRNTFEKFFSINIDRLMEILLIHMAFLKNLFRQFSNAAPHWRVIFNNLQV